MKNLYILLICFLIFTSCSKDSSPSIDINGTFTHTLLNCVNSTNPEINCIEYIWFDDNSTATIMFGGSDFGISTTYTLINNRIDFYYDTGVKSELSFKIINETTLKRIDNDNVWLKN